MSRLNKAAGVVGRLKQQLGPDAPETLAAKTELRTLHAERAIEDLINSAPAPTPAQLDRLRALLGTGSAVAE